MEYQKPTVICDNNCESGLSFMPGLIYFSIFHVYVYRKMGHQYRCSCIHYWPTDLFNDTVWLWMARFVDTNEHDEHLWFANGKCWVCKWLLVFDLCMAQEEKTLMALCKIAVTPMHYQWSYCSLALSQWLAHMVINFMLCFELITFTGVTKRLLSKPCANCILPLCIT